METCKEIDVPNDMLIWEELLNFDSTFDSYQDLQNRYSSLHETYVKEIENFKKVKKNLKKCLKFYLKLSKKFEAQQKIIEALKKSIKEKISSLEESYKNQEKMKGLIEIYKRERSLYSGESNLDLKRDKDMLLEICCQLISESVKTNNIRNLTNLILKKFKKDLNNEKLNLLKGKEMNIKKEKCKIKELSCNEIADTNSFDMLIGNNFNQACEDKSEKEVIESKKFQNNIELFDQKSSVTSINNCTELNSMKSFDEWNEEIKKTDEENSKPPEKYLLSMKTNEKKVVHNKIEHFKTEALGTELVPGNLPPVEDNIQVISDFSNTKTESDKTSGSETCLLKNQKIIENSAIKINNVEFKDPPAVNCENSNLIEICSVPEKNSKNQLNTLPNSLSEKEKLELIDCGMNCSATNNSTEQSNSILHSVNKLKNDFAYQQGDFPPNFIKCKLENKVSSAWPNADSNIDSSVNFNKASESSMNSNNKSLNMHLGTKHLCDIEKIEKNNNKHINNIKNSSQKHCSGSEVVPSEVQMLPVFSRSILDVPHTEVESIHQFRDGNLNSIATLSSQEKKVASVEVFTYDNNSLNCDLFDYSNLEREIIPEISQNGVNNEENVDILESEKISFENLNNKTIINSLSKSLELEFSFEKKSEEVALEDSDLCDEERTKIFSEMTNVRLLSPIRDVSEKNFVTFETWQSKKDKHSPNKSFTMSAESDHNFYSDKKRDNTHCDTKKSKKFKLDEMTGKNNEGKSACGLLDSIMSAMSIQNKEFKSNAFRKGNLTNETSVGSDKNCGMQFPTACNKSNLDLVKLKSKNLVQKMDVKPDISNETRSFEIFQTTKKNYDKGSEILLKESIQKFIASPNSTKEEADKNVKKCISVLSSNSDEVIARVIVGMVFENVNEEVENHERPVPPLTTTQYHLIILLSVFKSQDPTRENIPSIIMGKILQKLFPDQFQWPDDSVEMACRFYTALCRNRNDIQTCWKFCLQAMMEMKQRSYIAVFTALKTWPDILHQASTFTSTASKGNVLALTVVNIFLHMPIKSRNAKQQKKLSGLKHLLTAFYGFEANDTIENYAGKILELFLNGEATTEKSLVLLAKYRDVSWTRKYVLSQLFASLSQWLQGEIAEEMGHKVLGVLKQLIPDFSANFRIPTTETQEIILCLSKILTSRQMNHESEQKIIEVLLEMKQYQSVRQIIREWLPKKPISENLRNKIANASAENILQELKFNRKKHSFGNRSSEGGKRRAKKLKGKLKNKRKKIKKNQERRQYKSQGGGDYFRDSLLNR